LQGRIAAQATVAWIATAKAGISTLQENDFDVLLLDHDLGGETFVDTANENTGSEVVRWMLSPGNVVSAHTLIIIHSLNTPAATEMQRKLTDGGFTNVHRIPFYQLIEFVRDPTFFNVQ
jgi:hypothetical protein